MLHGIPVSVKDYKISSRVKNQYDKKLSFYLFSMYIRYWFSDAKHFGKFILFFVRTSNYYEYITKYLVTPLCEGNILEHLHKYLKNQPVSLILICELAINMFRVTVFWGIIWGWISAPIPIQISRNCLKKLPILHFNKTILWLI